MQVPPEEELGSAIREGGEEERPTRLAVQEAPVNPP